MIWWWVAGAVVTTIVTALASDDSSSSSSSSSDDYDRRLREENNRTEEEARERARQNREKEKTAQNLANKKNLAVTFLKQHYKSHKKLSVFISSINQLNIDYSVKQKFEEIVRINLCDDIQILTTELENNKSKVTKIEGALSELNHLRDSLNG